MNLLTNYTTAFTPAVSQLKMPHNHMPLSSKHKHLPQIIRLICLLMLTPHAAKAAVKVFFDPVIPSVDRDAATSFVNRLAKNTTNSPEIFKKELDGYYEKQLKDRVQLYLASAVTVRRLPESRAMRTRLNFREERDTIRFTLEAPYSDLKLKEHKLEIDLKRGNASRIRNRRELEQPDKSVLFSFVLVEPDATENDLHIEYSASAVYSFTPDAAKARATFDLGWLGKFHKNALELFRAQKERTENRFILDSISALQLELVSLSEKVRLFETNSLREDSAPVDSETVATGLNWHNFFYLALIPISCAILGGIFPTLLASFLKKRRLSPPGPPPGPSSPPRPSPKIP